MFKLCTKCNKRKNISDFNFKNFIKKIRQAHCRSCTKKIKKEYYDKNKSQYILKAIERKKQIREWWQEHKKQFKCKCGESHPACIEFHHHQKNKEGNVSNFICKGSIVKALKEIEKCIPICSNCHAKLHYKLRNNKDRANN